MITLHIPYNVLNVVSLTFILGASIFPILTQIKVVLSITD